MDVQTSKKSNCTFDLISSFYLPKNDQKQTVLFIFECPNQIKSLWDNKCLIIQKILYYLTKRCAMKYVLYLFGKDFHICSKVTHIMLCMSIYSYLTFDKPLHQNHQNNQTHQNKFLIQ